MKKLFIILVSSFVLAAIHAQTPQPVGGGINAVIQDFATDGTNLLIGNDSLNGGGYMVREWNGSSYTNLALPIPNSAFRITSVSYFNGGRFATEGSYIYKLGDTKYARGGGIYDLFNESSNLYIVGTGFFASFNYYYPTAGSFSTTPGAISFDDASWNAMSSWTGCQGRFGRGRSIGGSTYFVGNLAMYSGTVTNVSIVKWNGSSFSAPYGNNNIVTASNQYVSDMTVFNGEMYACGNLATTYGKLVKWNGSSWVAVTIPVSNILGLGTMTVFDNKLWICGQAGSIGPNSGLLVYYDGSTWTRLPGFNNSVSAMQVVNSTLFVGGTFTSPQNHIAQIAARPVAAFSASSGTICSAGCVTFANASTNATSYSWTFSGGTPAASSSQNPGTVCFAGSGTHTVTLIVSNIGGSDTAIVAITVNPSPIVSANATASVVCAGTSVTLSGSGTAASYAWSGGITNGVGFVPSSTSSYTVTGTSSNGCTNAAATSVVVNPTASANAGTDVTIMSGNSTTLSGSGNGTYDWTPPTGLSCTTCANPNADPTVTTTYTLSVTNSCGTAVDSVTVTVAPNVTGITEHTQESEIILYPNPTDGKFSISEKECELVITNILGEKILSQNDKSEIDLSSEQPGIYFIRMKTSAGTVNKKIIRK